MSIEPLPPPAEPPPLKPRPRPATIALNAVLGFVAYVGVALLAMLSRSPIVAIFLPGLLVVIAVIMAIAGTARGFALGVFIGVGLMLVAVGLCFAALANL